MADCPAAANSFDMTSAPNATKHRRTVLMSTTAAVALILVGLAGQPVGAQVFWDGTDTTADADGGDGTWDTGTTANWDTAATGGADTTFSNGDAAVFEDTAGTVTVSGTVNPSSMSFNTDLYTVTGGTIDTTGGLTVNVAAGLGTTIASTISGTGGVTFAGPGGVTLNGTVDVDGAASVAGTVTANQSFSADGGTTVTGALFSDAAFNSALTVSGGGSFQTSTNTVLTGNVVNGGTVTMIGGAITGDFDNNGSLLVQPVVAGSEASITGDLDNTGGTIAEDGTGGPAILNVTGSVNLGGSFDGGAVSLTVNADSMTYNGMVGKTGTVILNTDELVIAANRTETGDLNGSTTGTLTYDVIINSGITVDVDATGLTGDGTQDITNNGTFNIDDGSVTGINDYANNAGATTTIGDGHTLSAGTITNGSGATITVGAGSTLQGTDNTLNNDGTINVGAGGSVVDAGDINNDTVAAGTGIINFNGAGGILNSGGTINNGVAGNNATAGQINVIAGADVTVTATGGLNNNGASTITVAGTGGFDGATNSVNVTNTDTATIDNDGTFSANDVINSSTAAVGIDNSGTFDAASITNTGTFSNTGAGGGAITGAINNNAGGVFNHSSTGTMTAGSVTNNGAGADLNVSSGILDVAGAVTNTLGSVDVTGGELEAASLSNAASQSVTLSGGGLMDIDSITNDGIFSAAGTGATAGIDGSVTNQGSGTFTLTGNLDVTGSFANNANSTLTLGGNILNTGANFTQASTNAITVGAGEEINATGSFTNDTTVTNNNTVTADSMDNNGTFNSSATTTITNAWDNTGGTLNVTGGTTGAGSLTNGAGGDVNVSAGALNVTGAIDNDNTIDITGTGTLTGDSMDNDGTVNTSNTVTITNLYDNTGGTTNVTGGTTGAGSLTNGAGGDVNVSAGAFNVTGAIDNDNTIDITGTGTLTGDSMDNDGTLNTASTVTITNALDNTGGTVNVTGGTTGAGSLTNGAGGDVNVSAGALNVTGAIDNDNTIDVTGTGVVTGDSMDNDGTVNTSNTVTITNALDNTGGTLNVTGGTTGAGSMTNGAGGDVNVSAGALNVTGDLTNAAAFDVSGTGAATAGSVSSNTGTFTNSGSGLVAITGAFTNGAGGTITNSGTGSITMASLTNSAASSTIDVSSGLIDAAGAITNTGGTVNVTGGATLMGNTMTSSGTVNVTASTLNIDTGDFDNSGALNLETAAGVTVAGTLNNTGSINTSSSGTITGAVNNAGGLIDINGTTSSLTVTGGVTGGGTVEADVSVGATGTLVSDLSGTVDFNYDFTPGTLINETVVTGNTAGVTVGQVTGIGGASGLTFDPITNQAGFGVFVYEGTQSGIASSINAGAASISGNVALVQSLINTIVNRPSSPFVSGLAYEDDDNCGTGGWARLTGGRAEATAVTDNGLSATPSTVNATFGGLTLGADYGCFDAASGEWDFAGGAILGYNIGKTDQFVPGIGGVMDSTTNADFQQGYIGGYVAAARGPLSADVQLRFENTKYNFDNPTIDLRDEDTTTTGVTLSGSLSYSMPVNDDTVFVPTAGFGVTRSSTDPINFYSDPAKTVQVGTMSFEDHTTSIAFVGGTFAKSKIGAAGDSATNRFVTATYYVDLSEDMQSSFSDGVITAPVSTAPLGNFGELSLGLSYIKILDGQVGRAKQLNASIRADARFSEDVEALSITGQIRLQF